MDARAMTIRDAREADLARIVAIYNEAVPGRRATADTEPVTVESRLPWFQEHSPARRPLWVAERDGAIVGWLSFQSFYGRPAYAATAEVSVYVSSAAQRERRRPAPAGAGDRACAATSASRRCWRSSSATTSPACGSSRPHGFARWGHLPRVAPLDGREADLLILGRRLG